MDAKSFNGDDTRDISTEGDPPDGWQVCGECGQDADEADFNPVTRRTICAWCRGDKEPDTEHLFEAAMCAKYPVVNK